MIKVDLIKKIAKTRNVSKEEAEAIVDAFLNTLKATLENGEEIELRKFGSFRIREQGPRPGRDFRTGEEVEIPARKTVYFKPSKNLKIRK